MTMKGMYFYNNTAMDSKITVKLVDTLNKISNREFLNNWYNCNRIQKTKNGT